MNLAHVLSSITWLPFQMSWSFLTVREGDPQCVQLPAQDSNTQVYKDQKSVIADAGPTELPAYNYKNIAAH